MTEEQENKIKMSTSLIRKYLGQANMLAEDLVKMGCSISFTHSKGCNVAIHVSKRVEF